MKMYPTILLAGIRLFVGILFLGISYFVVNQSNFYYLFLPNIILLVSFALISEAIVLLLCSVGSKLSARKEGIIGTMRATFIVLFIADAIIRLTGIMQTYSERADGNYFSQAKQEKLDSWYWVHTPNTDIKNKRKEFVFERKVNSIGLSEHEINKNKNSKFRILALGDSFTEGVGINYKDTWVKQMETRWNASNVQTINAGIGGSDPVYAFALYRDKLRDFKPDMVVMTINSTDIKDIGYRGGFERFRKDGTAGKDAPSWEWIYASNHLVRMILRGAFHYDSGLLKNTDSDEMKRKSVRIIEETMVKLNSLTKKENCELLVVLQPSLQEFNDGKHTPFFGQLTLARFLKERDINYVDVSHEFKKKGTSIQDYYYPLDTHFNKKGYSLFGETIYKKIEELEILQ
jgi:lysophospholipase L1-like esterase